MRTARAGFSSSSGSRRPWVRVADLAAAPEVPTTSGVLAQLGELKRLAVVPAYNEEASVGRVIDEIRAFDPGFDIVVVDDGSTDRTAGVAADRGVHVVRLPFNLGIGGAVQTGYRFAFERGYDLAVQVDGDGQHDPAQLPRILGPVLDGSADLVVGSRFAGPSAAFRSSAARRIGIRIFARVVSTVVRQRVTDTTSGFRAVNRKGIALFAADYPHDYPEVEATVMSVKHKLRLEEVPVEMRERSGGRSSITALRSVYYMAKVLLAIFVGLFRRYAVPLEEEHR
jgi:glycosyltransferase involved in cell wall biosynthesis